MSYSAKRRMEKMQQAAAQLARKRDRTAQEEAALRSYRKLMIWSVIIALVAMAVLVPLLMQTDLADATHTTLLYGYVEGDKVSGSEMVDGGRIEFRDFTLEELGIDPASVADGDKITFHYDQNDTFTYAEPESARLARGNKEIALLVGGVLLLALLPTLIMRGTVAKPFRLWYRNVYLKQ